MDRDPGGPAGHEGWVVSDHVVYAVSDSTGETAEQAVRAALAQFRPRIDVRTLVFGRIRDEATARSVVERAKAEGALVVYTIVEGENRMRMKALAEKAGVPAVDLLSPLLHVMGRHLDRKPLSVAGLGHETDAAYFRRIDAVEFTIRHDDGRLLDSLTEAEIVLVGVSRTSKTPLSNYIAHRGLKVANVPIVQGLPVAPQLDRVDPRRVFGLLIDPGALSSIRRRRMEAMGVEGPSAYGDPQSCRDEILWARRIFREHEGWTVLDITDRAIEETAAAILELYREHFEAGAETPDATQKGGKPAPAKKPGSAKKPPAKKKKTSTTKKKATTGRTAGARKKAPRRGTRG